MSKGAVNFAGTNIEYYTPKSLVSQFGRFDYDPATTKEKAIDLEIPYYDTIETDGLKQDWTIHKRIWINPPFNIKHAFFVKAVETYKQAHNEIYFLCPIEFLTTKRFHETIKGLGVKLHIPNGRIKFSSGVGANEKSPAFGSIVLKIQDTNELELINL